MDKNEMNKLCTQINTIFWEKKLSYEEVLAILGELNQRQYLNKKKSEWNDKKENR